MEVAKNGFFPWLMWAWFSWDGRMNRLPYFGAGLLSTIPTLCIMVLIYWVYAGVVYGFDFARSMGVEDFLIFVGEETIPYYLSFPLIYISVALDAKRLRSMDLPPVIGIILHVVHFFAPLEGPVYIMVSLLVVVYFFCLLFVPPVETTVTPPYAGTPGRNGDGFAASEQSTPWPAGTAKPRRYTPRIRDWRVIAPAPRRDGK